MPPIPEITKYPAERPGLADLIVAAPRSSRWLLGLDLFPALTAAALPWSTTGVAILIAIWFVLLLPTLGLEFLRFLKRPACALPLAFFALALAGMLWSDDPLADRMLGLAPVSKLLAIPFLIYHFRRSQRGHWVFIAFVASCALLMGLSWVTYFADWKVSANASPGVPVRNYIDQSHEFVLCLFLLAPLLVAWIGKPQRTPALAVAILMLGFYCSLIYVATARTVVIYVPVLLILFAFRYFTRRSAVWFLGLAVAISVLLSYASPYARQRAENTALDYKQDRDSIAGNSSDPVATSNGLRMAYWRLSMRSIAVAPLFGHGTGSTKELFEREARGKKGAWAQVVRNPHNQTLYVWIQWGALGGIVLFSMWCFHLGLFRGPDFTSWVGLVVVVQNVMSSLLNSHLFDFHEGWIYVLGVGVAGGMVSRLRDDTAKSGVSAT